MRGGARVLGASGGPWRPCGSSVYFGKMPPTVSQTVNASDLAMASAAPERPGAAGAEGTEAGPRPGDQERGNFNTGKNLSEARTVTKTTRTAQAVGGGNRE